MTRTDPFVKELKAYARQAEAAGWRWDEVKKVWRHALHARHYASITMLYERVLSKDAT